MKHLLSVDDLGTSDGGERNALRSGIETDAPRMLTRKEARALPDGEVSWVRVVSLSTLDGTAVDAGVLVFGTDPVATDTTAATLMGLDPAGIWYLREGGRFLGQSDPERIQQVGEAPERLITPFDVLPAFASLRLGSSSPSRGGHAGLG